MRPPLELHYVTHVVGASAFVTYRTTSRRTYCISCPDGRGPGHPEGYPGPVGAKNPVGTGEGSPDRVMDHRT
jgi:hypothetical protein